MIVAVARLRFPEKFPFIQILAFVIVIVVLIINRVHHLDDFIFIPSVCFCTIAIFAQGSSVFHGILSSRPLLYLGEISYSTYLIHYFSKDWSKFLFSVIGPATFVLYAFTVLVLSVALYYIIEIPGRDFGRKFKIERTS
jgi:peptidoglycan/LPS O-acetylase OafA/YrhL